VSAVIHGRTVVSRRIVVSTVVSGWTVMSAVVSDRIVVSSVVSGWTVV